MRLPSASLSAAIAQLVEHFIRNEKVVGSSPTRGSRVNRCVKYKLDAPFLVSSP